MEDGKPNLDNENSRKFTETAHESSWGSLHDSELNIVLRQQFSKGSSSKNSSNIEITTDVDTDEDFPHEPTKNRINTGVSNDINSLTLLQPAKESVSDDWGSMNDSQFISFVNKLSQTQRDIKASAPMKATILSSDKVNHTAENSVFLDDEFQISFTPKSKISNISSSPILLAQKLIQPPEKEKEVVYQEDVMTKQDYEDADNYAFEDHEGYFKIKNTKQRKQDKEYSAFLKGTNEDGQAYPPIFSNCAIHINGRTEPDILQLRKMILLHGGTNVPYLSSKGVATHIVAEFLPPRKRIQFFNCKVVSPKWIVESIAAKKLLNWAKYRLEQLGEYGQKEIDFYKEVKTVEKKDAVNEKNDIVARELETDDNILVVEEEKAEKEDVLSQELNRAGVDARDPNFLHIFFSKSRLHHLSTWKADLRSEFLNRAAAVLKERQSDAPRNNTVQKSRVILHVDFDCFFARVSANLHEPIIDFDNTPCCVTHGGASADISSCNYVAREFGVKNGMWFSKAQKLCPNIVCLPYQFDEYERVSKIFYAKLLSLNIDSILPVSIDEALVDISSLCIENGDDIMGVLKNIKHELDVATDCTVSCGCGRNVLLAKLALRKAKPNGFYIVPSNEDEILRFLDDIDVKKLPGFGNRLFDKLLSLMGTETNTAVTLNTLRCLEKEKLVSSFGIKMGEKLYLYSRGVDDTSIDLLSDPEKYLRKSLGIDVNWGIRFSTNAEVENFLNRLAVELSKRLVDCGMTGSMLTLKLSIRHPDAPIEPPKYLGMGYCTFISKSSRLGISTRATGILSPEMKYLWRFLNIDPKELRGVGVSMNKLVPEGSGKIDTSNQLKLQFKPASVASANTTAQKESHETFFEETPALKPPADVEHEVKAQQSASALKRPRDDNFYEEIDWEVFDDLPASLQDEIKKELRKRKLQSSPMRKKVANGKDIAFMLSPSKRTPKNVQPNDTFNLITPEKVKNRDDNEIIFQGINISEESKILKKLLFWMDFTLEEENGIDKKDLELFKDFMLELIARNDVIRYKRIVSAMSFYLHLKKDMQGYEEWLNQLDHLKGLLDEQSFATFEFRF